MSANVIAPLSVILVGGWRHFAVGVWLLALLEVETPLEVIEHYLSATELSRVAIKRIFYNISL